MNIQQAVAKATLRLQAKQIKTAFLDAEVLLSFTLAKPKEFLYTHSEKKLTKSQMKKFGALITRRTKGEPVAYLRKQKEFYGLDFYVDKRVLIPRPETELLVEEVIKRLTVNRQPSTVTIADIGTGSGCIIIALAKSLLETCNLKHVTYYATDISRLALQVAKINARKHKVKINFFQGDLLKPLENKKNDLIVANLPYLDDNYKNLLKSSAKTSLKFEPKIALAGYQYGLAIYERFFKQISQLKNKPKFIVCEIGHTYTAKLRQLLKKYLPQYRVEIKKDLAGLNRILVINLTNA